VKDLRYFDPHRRATWLELFFDLIVVVAVGDAGEILSEAHGGHIGTQQLLHFVLVFLPLWWIWAGHTIYANRFDTDSRQHRLSTLVIMFLLIVISAQISAGARDQLRAGRGRLLRGAADHRRDVLRLQAQAPRPGWLRNDGGHRVRRRRRDQPVLGPAGAPWSYLVFYAGILFDMAALVLLNRRLHVVPAHTPHLIERVGLLTIIMLGESVISISAALAGIAWNRSNVIAAVSGFVMVSAIWWIYYDSFPLLEHRKLTTGHSILYSHFFLFVGLAILASLIRHAILGDLAVGDFRRLAAVGTVLFFLGKQYGYYREVPELRPYLVSNTAAVFALTALVLMLPLGIEATLVGMTATMICYVLLNLRYRHLVRAG
jgi:low temperature requirement protein LtrA